MSKLVRITLILTVLLSLKVVPASAQENPPPLPTELENRIPEEFETFYLISVDNYPVMYIFNWNIDWTYRWLTTVSADNELLVAGRIPFNAYGVTVNAMVWVSNRSCDTWLDMSVYLYDTIPPLPTRWQQTILGCQLEGGWNFVTFPIPTSLIREWHGDLGKLEVHAYTYNGSVWGVISVWLSGYVPTGSFRAYMANLTVSSLTD